MTDHLELSIIIGTRVMSGSEAMSFKKVVIASLESNMPSSMFTSIIWAPPSTCCRATAKALSRSPLRINFENAGEPVTFVRSPILTKLVSGRMVKGSRPLRRV